MKKFLIAFSVALIFVVIFLPGVFRSKKLFDVSPLVGRTPPDFQVVQSSSFTDIDERENEKMENDGKLKRLSEIVSENEVVLVNFFASWCEECSHERRTLLNLKGKAKIIGVVFRDEKRNVKNYLDELNPYDYIFFDNGETAVEYGVTGVPETFLILRGKIVRKFVGPVSAKEIMVIISEDKDKINQGKSQ